MAYKLSITNPHEYSLYLINDGEGQFINLSERSSLSHNVMLSMDVAFLTPPIKTV